MTQETDEEFSERTAREVLEQDDDAELYKSRSVIVYDLGALRRFARRMRDFIAGLAESGCEDMGGDPACDCAGCEARRLAGDAP